MKVNALMRNSQWGKHQDVFDSIKLTKKLICPGAHRQNIVLINENNKYSYDGMKYQANQFLNELFVNNIVLLFDKGHKEALILRITSNPKQDKIKDVIILRNKTCNIHVPVSYTCANCNDSIVSVFSTKYFENNKFTKYLNEDYFFENMYAVYRDVEVIGKIDETSDVYQSCKTLRNTIQIPRNNEYLLPAIF